MSHRFEVKKLLRMCEQDLSSSLDLKNAIDILQAADLIESEDLKNAACGFIVNNFKVLRKTQKWKKVIEPSNHLLNLIMQKI
jgi:hypothetical protein